MKLGTLLLRDAVIGLSQLEGALRQQVLYGGKLGTNLVELGFVDIDMLGAYLSRTLEVPLATPEHFEAAEETALQALGPGLADVYTAVPLFFEDDGQTLAVALSEPTNKYTIEKLSNQCGVRVQAYVAPELRLLYYLEKFYNINRKARFVRTEAGATPSSASDERRRATKHANPTPVLLVPKRPSTDRQFAQRAPSVPEPRLSYEEAADRIDTARDRDAIGEALIEFTVGRVGAAVLFVLRERHAVGWRFQSASGSGMEDSVEELSLPLDGTSVLQIAFDSEEMWRGPPPGPGMPVERRLWEATATAHDPKEVLVIPIRAGHRGGRRVVNLFYAHPIDQTEFGEDFFDECLDLSDRFGKAFTRLLGETP